MPTNLHRPLAILTSALLLLAGCVDQIAEQPDESAPVQPQAAEPPAAPGQPSPNGTVSPPAILEPHIRFSQCKGGRILSDWAPDTLPWGLEDDWEAPFGAAPIQIFVALRCAQADVGGVWSFQNVSFVWERHTNLSAGPELDERYYHQLTATLDMYTGPEDFRGRLADIGLATRPVRVDADEANLDVRATIDDGVANLGFSDLTYESDGPPSMMFDVVTLLDVEPVTVLTGTVQNTYGHVLGVPEFESSGSFHTTRLAEEWPAPVAWRGSFIDDATIDLLLETLP